MEDATASAVILERIGSELRALPHQPASPQPRWRAIAQRDRMIHLHP